MSFWDDRYRGDNYAYGTEPNDFLRASVSRIPLGRVLCLAEGEGRNAVYLAARGYAVTAVDLSAEGLRKAERLARERGVVVELVQADLTSYELPGDLAGVVSIFAHVPAVSRQRLHAQIPAALRPGGAFVLEAYRPEQLAFNTGGPRDAALLPTLADLRRELASLTLVVAQEVEREVQEGNYHCGRSATVQVVGLKPD
ncbi:MAG TPA: class I SAM-dependent methyltransferase [Polyangiaceae bacterium]